MPADLAKDYLTGAVLLAAAPFTAMVCVWSHLTKGNPAYTVVQVATNDLIILIAFVPIVKFLLGISDVHVPWDTLFPLRRPLRGRPSLCWYSHPKSHTQNERGKLF